MAANALTRLSSSSTLWPHLKILTFSAPKSANYNPVFAMANATTTKVAPAVIVGGGRVGRALQEMGNGQDLLVKRGEPVPLDFDGPVLVCTRNDDLEAVLEATPQSRWNGTDTLITLFLRLLLIVVLISFSVVYCSIGFID